MADSLQDKKCFVTGAGNGIGRATALALARAGAELFLTDLDAARLDEIVREVRRSGGRVAEHRALDIASFDAVRAFAEQIHARHGSLDAVLNIAGISIWGTVENLEHRHWQKTIDVNLMGPIHVIESFLPAMIRAGRGGYLVNVSSAAGLFGLPWHAAYSASKFGLRGISEVLRFDLARHDIHVSLVCPGGVDTPLVRTHEIVGIDKDHKDVAALQKRFRRHAVSPDSAARAIVQGMQNRQYMVFTSKDIRWGYWLQRKFALPYELTMRLLNDSFSRLTKAARAAAVQAPRTHEENRAGPA